MRTGPTATPVLTLLLAAATAGQALACGPRAEVLFTEGAPDSFEIVNRSPPGWEIESLQIDLPGGEISELTIDLDRDRRPRDRDTTRMAATDGPPGTLTFDARPWCNVSIDGRSVGQTPIVNRSLPAGRHRISCVNPELNARRNITVTIESGQPTRRRIDLQ